MLASFAGKGSWDKKPDHKNKLTDKEENTDGEDEDLGSVGIERLFVKRKRPHPVRRWYGLGRFSHDTDIGMARRGLLVLLWY